MHTFSRSILVVSLSYAVAQCNSTPSTTSTPAIEAKTGVVDSTTKSSFEGSRQVESSNDTENHVISTSDPDPNVPYQDVNLTDVESQPTSYTARLPVQKTPSGRLSLQVELNPQKHSIKKLTLLYARQNQWHTIKQIGNGVGHYNTTSQRYYVNVAYQEILELSDKLQYSGDLQEVNCWIAAQTNTAGIQYVKLDY